MYQYLIGAAIMGIVWALLFWFRKDLRRAMVWSGLVYIFFLSFGFVIYQLVATDAFRSITPGYWTPPTLFDLGHKTSGYGLEDALFMFFGGGMAAALYHFVFSKKLGEIASTPRSILYPLLVGCLAALAFHYPIYLNDVYLLIVSSFFGALTIIWLRRDLVVQSLMGGLLFLIVYIALFLLFKTLFPDFLDSYYHLQATSGLWLLGVPLEEYLFALSFGMMWGPLYSYTHGLKDQPGQR